MIGTMNNAGTVLLTLADMSVIQAEVEVDETNIPHVQLGQTAKITIDALPDQTFTGHVTEIGNSPIQAATGRRRIARRRRTSRSSSCSTSEVPDVRPGFTCTADITTATRKEVVGGADSRGGGPRAGLRRQRPDRQGAARRDKRRRAGVEPVASAAELQARTDPQGNRRACSSCATARAEFVPIKMGIAGDRYFEVLSGLKAGDQVITGPYNSVRSMADGDAVKVETTTVGRRRQVGRAGQAAAEARSAQFRASGATAI